MKQQQKMQKRCVLIGNQGAGKTRLFNKICSQNEKSDQSMDSNTKMIAQSQSVSGYGFHLQDTPGFGSYDNEVLTHSIGILAALTDGPIHRIILVVEHQQRIDILKSQIQETINIVQEYHQLISIIITYKDECKIPIQEYFNKAQEMIQKCFEVQSVFFSGQDTKCEELCQFIDQALLDNGKIIKIQDSKFDKMMQGYIDDVLRQAKEEFYNKFQEFYQAAKFFLDNFKSEIDDSQQILHHFISFVRNKSTEIQSNFEKNYGPFMEELNEQSNDPVKAYYYHSVLKHSISEQVQELIKTANQKMKYPEDHPFMSLRRCPHCGTMWLKVAGCDGITYCGNRTNKYQTDVIITSLFNIYKFYLTNNQIQYNVILDQPQYTNEQISFIKKITKDLISQYGQLKQFINRINQENFEDINQFIYTFAERLNSPIQSQDIKRDEQQKNKIFFQQAKNEIKKKLVEYNHRNQIKNGGQIGCGSEINWQSAPLVDVNEIDIDQVQILESLSKGNLIYQEQFHIHKQKLVLKAQQEKKILAQN